MSPAWGVIGGVRVGFRRGEAGKGGRDDHGAQGLELPTHSPELLDLFTDDQVRVVQRHEGISTVAALRDDRRQAVRQGLLTLGELMHSEGLQQELPLDRTG